RGGLRSEISSQWIREAGKSVEMIPGGYKALRHYLMQVLETHSQNRSFLLLAGRTGSGKTQVLNKVTSPFLDLEKHANHKGSSFGGQGPQPAQITFENSIAVDLLKTRPDALILVEDEAVMIGTAVVPKFLFERMKRSPLLVLERSMGERVQTIAEEYVFEKTNYFLGDFRKTETFMLEALHRIQARLGGLNHTLIHTQITNAFASVDVKRAETHFDWIESLLTHYYDPLYDRGLKKSAERIAFQGNEVECLQYLKEKTKS
ncbi:MAG: tRNA 2-selenouridine(34) synthase MnmH, partial [Bdellovibrionales bacterium]|nr:tRNA 2-selenouridine(34) synthase MnmH [Oligoflexia bacterium]